MISRNGVSVEVSEEKKQKKIKERDKEVKE